MWRRFWLGIWKVIKSMGWKGIISFCFVWLILSGVGIIGVGFIIRNGWLIGVGTAIFIFWAGPGTPLVPITIAIAMLFQRYILRDKNISWKTIKNNFMSAFHNERKKRYKYKDLVKRSEVVYDKE